MSDPKTVRVETTHAAASDFINGVRFGVLNPDAVGEPRILVSQPIPADVATESFLSSPQIFALAKSYPAERLAVVDAAIAAAEAAQQQAQAPTQQSAATSQVVAELEAANDALMTDRNQWRARCVEVEDKLKTTTVPKLETEITTLTAQLAAMEGGSGNAAALQGQLDQVKKANESLAAENQDLREQLAAATKAKK